MENERKNRLQSVVWEIRHSHLEPTSSAYNQQNIQMLKISTLIMHWAYSLNLLYKAFLEKLAAWIIMFIIICWSPLPYRCCHVLYPHIATLFSTELCCKWLCWWHLSQIFISVEVFTHQWVTSDKVFNLERSGSCLVSLSLRYFYGSLFAQGCAGLHSLQKLLTKL